MRYLGACCCFHQAQCTYCTSEAQQLVRSIRVTSLLLPPHLGPAWRPWGWEASDLCPSALAGCHSHVPTQGCLAPWEHAVGLQLRPGAEERLLAGQMTLSQEREVRTQKVPRPQKDCPKRRSTEQLVGAGTLEESLGCPPWCTSESQGYLRVRVS